MGHADVPQLVRAQPGELGTVAMPLKREASATHGALDPADGSTDDFMDLIHKGLLVAIANCEHRQVQPSRGGKVKPRGSKAANRDPGGRLDRRGTVRLRPAA